MHKAKLIFYSRYWTTVHYAIATKFSVPTCCFSNFELIFLLCSFQKNKKFVVDTAGCPWSFIKQLWIMMSKLIAKILFIINVNKKCVNFLTNLQQTALKSSQDSNTFGKWNNEINTLVKLHKMHGFVASGLNFEYWTDSGCCNVVKIV